MFSKTGKINPKGIIFDFDNTLVDTNGIINEVYDIIFSDISNKFGVGKDRLFEESRRVQDENVADSNVAKKSYDHGEWIGVVVERLSINLPPGELRAYKDFFYSYMLNNPKFSADTESIVKLFKSMGKKLALLSEKDSIAGMKAKRIRSLPFSADFDAIVIAGETIPFGKLADGPKAFLETAKAVGLEPGELVMVGDRADLDIQNAKEAGMMTVLFDGYSKSKEIGKYRPDFVIHNISELAGIIS